MSQLKSYLTEADQAFHTGKYADAFHLYSRAVHLLEQHDAGGSLEAAELAEVYAMRASSLVAQDQEAALGDQDLFSQAMDDYDQALEILPHHPLYLNLRGEMHLNCRFANYAEAARSDFEHALHHDADNVNTMHKLGEALLKLEAFDEALIQFTQTIDQQANAESFRMRALCYLKKYPPNVAAAAADFGQALKLDPRNESLLQWRAECLQQLGKVSEAMELYDQLIRQNPNVADYFVERGVLAIETNHQAAMADFNRALDLEEHALAYNNRAFLHFQNKSYQAAIDDAMAAIKTDSDATVAYATLAEIYAELEDRDSFYTYLELAIVSYYTEPEEVLTHPLFAPYTTEMRFQQAIAKMQ